MGVPHVTSCCWCLGLEMGSRLIAGIHMTTSICLMLVASIFAEKFRSMMGTSQDIGDNVYTTWYTITIVVAVVSSGHVLLAVTLFYGVHQRSALAIRTWVWVMLILMFVSILCNIINLGMNGVSGTGSDMFLQIFLALIFYGLLSYFILCVNSFYLMVKSSEDMEGPSRVPY